MRLIVFLSCSLILTIPAWAQLPGLGTLKVEINGLQSADGKVRVGLEKSEEAFDKGDLSIAQYRSLELDAKLGSVAGEFADLPYGVYAIKVYHDANSNGKLDTNFLGVPKEAYGFSNKARSTFGPASFKAAKFEFNEKNLNHSIEVKQ